MRLIGDALQDMAQIEIQRDPGQTKLPLDPHRGRMIRELSPPAGRA
jgi:hypothetical protein